MPILNIPSNQHARTKTLTVNVRSQRLEFGISAVAILHASFFKPDFYIFAREPGAHKASTSQLGKQREPVIHFDMKCDVLAKEKKTEQHMLQGLFLTRTILNKIKRKSEALDAHMEATG